MARTKEYYANKIKEMELKDAVIAAKDTLMKFKNSQSKPKRK